MLADLRQWASVLRRDVLALWLAARDPRTPLAAKLLAGAVAAYVLSPIDLIPDFIPVLGLLDDLVIVPAGIWLALRLVPAEVMRASREEAERRTDRPVSPGGAVAIGGLWLAGLAILGWWLLP